MMIANFFRKTKPIHAIIISSLFLGYYLLAIFMVEKPDFSFILLLKKTSFLIVFLVLFFVVRFINRKNYLSGKNAYVLLILAILFGTFPRTMELQSLFISHFFLLFAMRRIYSIRTFKSIKKKTFDSGFWIGVAALFYIWSSVFLILVFVAVFVHKRQEIRNFIIPVVGFITPFFLAFTYYFLMDNSAAFFDRLLFEYSFSFGAFSIINSLPIIGLFTLSFLAIIIVSIKIFSLENDLKPSWTLILSHFLIAIYLIILSPLKDGSELLYIFFPMAIIITNYVQLMERKFFKELVIYGMLLLSFSVYFL